MVLALALFLGAGIERLRQQVKDELHCGVVMAGRLAAYDLVQLYVYMFSPRINKKVIEIF